MIGAIKRFAQIGHAHIGCKPRLSHLSDSINRISAAQMHNSDLFKTIVQNIPLEAATK